MSVIRLGNRQAVAAGREGGQEAWIQAFSEALDLLKRGAEREGAHIDWDSLEFETETDFIETNSLMEPVRELRITTLRTSALAVMEA